MSAVKQASLPAQSAPSADALWRRGLERVLYGLAGLALFILAWRLASGVWRLAYVLD